MFLRTNLHPTSAIAGKGIAKQAPSKSAKISPPMKIFVDDCRSFLFRMKTYKTEPFKIVPNIEITRK